MTSWKSTILGRSQHSNYALFFERFFMGNHSTIFKILVFPYELLQHFMEATSAEFQWTKSEA
jgi:hypothetical protein